MTSGARNDWAAALPRTRHSRRHRPLLPTGGARRERGRGIEREGESESESVCVHTGGVYKLLIACVCVSAFVYSVCVCVCVCVCIDTGPPGATCQKRPTIVKGDLQ